jgi:general secretion pathway protein B
MSFILDALKKSELERRRQLVPGLVDAGAVRARARLPLWAVALGVLLAVNLGVLSFVLLRQAPAVAAPNAGAVLPPPALAATPAPAAAAPNAPAAAAPSSADHFSPMDGAPSYAPEILQSEDAKAPTLGPKPRASPRVTARVEDSGDDEVLPSLSELSLTGPEALPDLHLDVHVYATNPADRFVYVNGRKYHEGAHMQEGPLVEHIRRDGVVLSYSGIRFLLPRQ